MPKKKVAVALSDWLLDELDAVADEAGASRSSLVEEAVAAYVARRRSREDERAFRAGASLALEDMQRFAAECENDRVEALEPSTLERLRALRASGRGLEA